MDDKEKEKEIIENIKTGISQLYIEVLKEKEIPPILYQYLEEFNNLKYEMVILGNTKAGKSTLLNEIMEGKVMLNTGAARETSFMWRISFNQAYETTKMQEFYVSELNPNAKPEVEDYFDITNNDLNNMIRERLSRGSEYIEKEVEEKKRVLS